MTAVSPGSTHEDASRGAEIEIGSNASFGYVFTAVFAIVALWPLWDGAPPRYWSFGVAAVILAVTLVRPALLAPLNRIWFRFGLLLAKVANPIVMGLVFYIAVTPTAYIMRLRGKDLLRLKLDKAARSYWIDREPPGPDPETMKRQF